MSRSNPQLPSREEIVRLCEERGYAFGTLTHFPYNDKIWIKYGHSCHVTTAQAKTQTFVHQNADADIVYTPKIYDFFTCKKPSRDIEAMFIVMERIHGQLCHEYLKWHESERDEVLQDIARAVRHVWDLKLPVDIALGPFSEPQRVPTGPVFSDFIDRTFANITELEDWMNCLLKEENRSHKVDLSFDSMQLCHNDLTGHHIMISEDGGKRRIVMVDWGTSGVYPRSFEEYGLCRCFSRWNPQSFEKQLHKLLFGDKIGKNMMSLQMVAMVNEWGSRATWMLYGR